MRAVYATDLSDAVETHVMRGTPHRRINGLADRVDADLILAGSRGQSPLERRLTGGTARNVARTAVRPLLVQRIVEGEGDHEVANEHPFQRVRYATDFSENAERAFQQFRHLRTPTREATLLHVAPAKRRVGSDDDRIADAEGRLVKRADELAGMAIDARTLVREGAAVEDVTARAGSNVLLVPPSRTG
jgi:nucleotide-binding universal stress UspA family protein